MKTHHKVLLLSIILGIMIWIIDAGLHALFFSQGTFWETLIINLSASDISFRLIILVIFIFFVVIISKVLLKHQQVGEEFKGVNRALKVISESNKVLVHAEEEEALLREICRIIVKTGSYRLAWVGYAEQDSQRSVKLVAQWGEGQDYIDTFCTTWADHPTHQCPTGTAIRTGTPVAVGDILAESHFKAWQEKSLSFGYRSALALPLTHYEQTFGALTIYAGKANAFSREEIKLLSGLADDLAYGIDALHSRTYHKMAEELIQEYYTSLAFLSQTIIELIELSPQANIYRYIGQQLYKLIKPAAVIINCYDKATEVFKVCQFIATDTNDSKAQKKTVLPGKNPVGMTFSLPPPVRKTFCQPKLFKIRSEEISSDSHSDAFSDSILQFSKELFARGEGEVFSIGMQKDDILFGHALVLLAEGKELKNVEVIETFIHQASIILHRRHIEQELTESENKFRLLAEISPGAIFIHRGQKILYANHATKLITGYSQRELGKMNFWEILAPQYQEQQKHAALQLLSGRDLQKPSELMLEKKKGDVCWVQMISKAFEFEGSAAVMVTAVDITQVKKAQEMEKRHQQELMQADKMISLGNLVAGVAHEINNPTNAIMVNTPVLTDIWETLKPIVDQYYKQNGDFEVGGIPYSEIPASMSDLFSGITESAKRIKTIIEDLKNFARPNHIEMTREVDVNEVLKQAITLLQNMIAKATSHFSAHYGVGLPLIKGNPQQLEQVFINLIRNACQALENNRKAIHVYTAYDPTINRVVIGVKDEGHGISSENLKFIMDPFFTTKRNNGGTGLGLSVSSRIIRDHHGEINIESIVGKGSLFTVLLPDEETESVTLPQNDPGEEI